MENHKEIEPHPLVLDKLFTSRKKIMVIFSQILHQHKLDHLAITSINKANQISVCSSTPAIEFNLFSGNLWQSDLTYHPSWYEQECFADWESLYLQERYDELYYVRQHKHQLKSGISISTTFLNHQLIISYASIKTSLNIKQLSQSDQNKLLQSGLFGAKQLSNELFNYSTCL